MIKICIYEISYYNIRQLKPVSFPEGLIMLGKLIRFFTKGGSRQVLPRALGENFAVSGQLTPEQLPHVSSLGYRTLICMRPDNEGFDQPAFSAMETAARAAGIDAHYLPVVPGALSREQAQKLKQLMRSSKGPVLAYCASGNRCASAYAMASRL